MTDTPTSSILLRELFAERLPYRVINRLCIGVARNVETRTGKPKLPHAVTLSDLLHCTAWDLITVEGVGPRAWRSLFDELSKMNIHLKDRPANLDVLTTASLVAQDILTDESLSTTARSRAKQFLKAQELLLYQLDYESRRTR